MANTSIMIPLLFGGVSTQAPALRFANQVSVATNALMTASAGSELRPGTRMKFAISGVPPTTLPPTTLPATTAAPTTLPPTTLAPTTAPPDICLEYTITDAGTTTANGAYSFISYINDKPFYASAENELIMWDGARWNIYDVPDPPDPPVILYEGDSSDTPDLCAWTVVEGESPTPTVTCTGTMPPTTLPPTTLPPTTLPDTTLPDTTLPDTTIPETTTQ